MPAYLAVDLGAESGRVLRGDFDGSRLVVNEVHRFANQPVRRADGLYWDVEGLYAQVLQGIAGEPGVRSVGVDGWGNDFGLLDRDGALLAPAWHHRTPRTAGMVDRLLARVDADELYAVTGTQFLPITMACQLLAMQGSTALARAERLATVPDLIASWLSGRRVSERTIASTSQLWDIRRSRWASGLIDRLGLPAHLFADEVLTPGTPVGPMRRDLLPGVAAPPTVVAVAGHDTACAVAAVPAGSPRFGYVSCGTWSLVGLETADAITTPQARLARFTNEAGVEGTVRFLSNVNGLWLLQECRRVWARGGQPSSYPALVGCAEGVTAFGSLIDPDDASLLSPGDMPARIVALCRATGEPLPGTRGEIVRCILDSLACKYRWVLERGAALAGCSVDAVHMVGGGAANPLLCRQTAHVTGLPVVAGPVEAAGVGNLLLQALADGRLGGLSDIRAVVAASFPLRTYEPQGPRVAVDDAYGRFERIVGRCTSAPAIGGG